MENNNIPLISIIIPIYNSEKDLDRCINSIISQSYSNIEIILVNDGSIDNSVSLCTQWMHKDKRITLINKTNSGVAATRNVGIKAAKGEYIIFIDSDDYMLPNMCMTLYKKIIDKQADCIICSILEPSNQIWGCKKETDYTSVEHLKNDYIKLQKTELLSPCWNKIYKKSLITTLFPENMSFGEDLVFCLNYIQNCQRISFIKDILIFHEKNNENSLTHKVDLNRLLDIERVLEITLSFYEDNKPVQIFNKYIRDLTIYSRWYMKNPHISYAKKVNELRFWRKQSHIHFLNIFCLPCNWKIKLQLYWLKHKLWFLLYIQVNKSL